MYSIKRMKYIKEFGREGKYKRMEQGIGCRSKDVRVRTID